ncbi:FHA domain-containing protein, partial [Cellulosimicrobium sp. I38E]
VAGEPSLPPPAPPGDGLIAGVPREWTGATPAAAHRAATVVDPDGEPTEAEGEPAPGLDHDGHTVHSSAIADLRAAAQDAGAAAPVPPPPSFSAPPGPGQQQILARTCAQGHANPPSRDACALCGGPLEGDAELAIRPPLGRVLVSTGQTVELDRPVVVGRRPRTPRSQAADLPRLVTVPSPQQDISRSHLEITLEGWHVLVSDMATTNGTTLLRAGQPPRRLHPSEPVLVVDGDVADLGDGVTLVFEGIR